MKEEQNNTLFTNWFFQTPIYSIVDESFLSELLPVTDKIIQKTIKRDKPKIKELHNIYGKKIKDHGHVYHSDNLCDLPNFKSIKDRIKQTSISILDNWGCDIKEYSMAFTELWVQEFSRIGGGHHRAHIHWNNHISGFYFLKCSEKTSYPIFHDPRSGAMMTKLKQKNDAEITPSSELVHFKPTPGMFIFFPSYLTHEFTVDNGVDPFQFIHFNLQAVPKYITNELSSDNLLR